MHAQHCMHIGSRSLPPFDIAAMRIIPFIMPRVFTDSGLSVITGKCQQEFPFKVLADKPQFCIVMTYMHSKMVISKK